MQGKTIKVNGVNVKANRLPFLCVVCNGFGTLRHGEKTCQACGGFGYIVVDQRTEDDQPITDNQ